MSPLRYVILVVFILVSLRSPFLSLGSAAQPPATDQPAFNPHYLQRSLRPKDFSLETFQRQE